GYCLEAFDDGRASEGAKSWDALRDDRGGPAQLGPPPVTAPRKFRSKRCCTKSPTRVENGNRKRILFDCAAAHGVPFALGARTLGGGPCVKNSHRTVSSRWPLPALS